MACQDCKPDPMRRGPQRRGSDDWKWPVVSLLLVAGSAAAAMSLLIGLFRQFS